MFPKINSILNLAINGLVNFLILWGLSSNKKTDPEHLLILTGFFVGACIFILFDIWCLRLYNKNKQIKILNNTFKKTGLFFLILSSIFSLAMLAPLFKDLETISDSDTILSKSRLAVLLTSIGIMLIILLGNILNIIFFIKALKKNNALFSGMINTIGEEQIGPYTKP